MVIKWRIENYTTIKSILKGVQKSYTNRMIWFKGNNLKKNTFENNNISMKQLMITFLSLNQTNMTSLNNLRIFLQIIVILELGTTSSIMATPYC